MMDPIESQSNSGTSKYKIKPMSENIPFGNAKVMSFQICENNNFNLFEQKEGEKPLDLRHCILVIFLQDDEQHWIVAEVGDCGDGPEIMFDYSLIPENSSDAGIINNKQFMPNRNDITIIELVQLLNKELAGKYYLLVRDNCYSLAHIIGQKYCIDYKGEAMEWCNKTILRTTSESAKYIGNKIISGTKEVFQQAPNVINQGINFGKNLMKNISQQTKKKN